MRKIFIIFLLLCSFVLADNPYRTINNLNAGELSPLLNAREDLVKYQSGCSVMENLIPIPQGGAEKRPGTKFISEVKTSSLKTRLLSFEFSTSKSFPIEAGNQYVRFYTDGARISQTSTTDNLQSISGLIAHWPMEEDDDNAVVNDSAGAEAFIGTLTDGTSNVNTSVVAATGQVGSGSFDLDAQYIVEIGDHTSLSFGDGSDDSAFSISAWINVATANNPMILTKWDQTTASEVREWTFGLTGKKPELTLHDQSNTKQQRRLADDALSNGWRHVVATYNGSGGGSAADGILLYADGVLVDSASSITDATYVAMENTATEVILGALIGTAGSPDRIIDDKVDSVAIFNKELTSTEVAAIFAGNLIYEIKTPYLTADIPSLKLEQSADVLYITHPSYETRELSRFGDTDWVLKAADRTTGPFRGQNFDTTKTITASATTGSVTLTAVGHSPFVTGSTAGHEPSGNLSTSKSQTGALFKIVHPIDELEFKEELESDFAAGQVKDTSWVDCGVLYKGATWDLVTGDTWFGTIKVQRNYTIGAAVGNGGDEGASLGWETVLAFSSGAGVAVDARNVTTSGTEDDGGAQYRVIYADEIADDTVSIYFTTDQIEHIGIVEITAVASPTSATATVVRTLASTDATYKWAEGSWSNYRGWPQTVTFFEDRLMFGGNTAQPDTIWGSVTGDYANMEAGPDDDEAVIFTLSSRQVNVIEWMVGKDKLLIGTSGAEWTIAGGTDEPLTPSNVIAKQHSTYGSANLQANLANESILFFQRGAEKMRELAYNWELDSYVAPDMTILANTVTNTGITDTAFQRTPNSILWTTRTDGEMPIFSYERSENITAWSRMITQTTEGTEELADFTSLVGQWKLNEDATNTSVVDASGNSHTGVSSANTDTLQSDEGLGGSFDMGGAAKVTITDHANLSFGDGSNDSPFSVAAWIYLTPGIAVQPIITKWETANQEWHFELTGLETLRLRLFDQSAGAQVFINSDAALATGWHHVVATYDGSGGATAGNGVLLYVDGSLVDSTATNNAAYVAMEDLTADVLIGSETIVSSSFFTDKLDNVAIFNAELTASQVAVLYLPLSKFESVAVINGSPEDEVWVIVERIIGGATVRYVEQFQPRDFGDSTDAIFVDSCVTYDSTASSAMTGLDHLDGQTVHVLADGVEFDTEVVAGGVITLSLNDVTTTASTVQMGLVYEVQLRTMPLSWLGGATIQGKTKRISEVVANWYKSGDFSIGRDASTLRTYSITGQTSDQDRKTFPPGFDRNGYIFMYQKSPEPLTVLAVSAEFDVQ